MLRQRILGPLGLLLGALAMAGLAGCESRTLQATDLPWQIEHTTEGSTRVFGITLGRTNLDEASRHLDKIPEIAVFIGAEGPESIEAYYGKTRVGVFDAKLLVNLAVAPETLAQIADSAGEPEPMPSGAWKRQVSEQDIPAVLQMPVRVITYVPSVAYEPDVVERRFGTPAQRLRQDEHSEYWLYPEQGLVMLIDSEGKEVLQYVAPTDFELLRKRIGQQKDQAGTGGE